MADDPTEAIIRREINRARQILREDKLLGKLNKAYPDEPEGDGEGDPKPPPKGEPKEQPKRKGVWWGHDIEE